MTARTFGADYILTSGQRAAATEQAQTFVHGVVADGVTLADGKVNGVNVLELEPGPLKQVGAGWSLEGGGDARGLDAVDLQMVRSLVGQVASGDYAAIGGGENNTASADHTTVSGGNTNDAIARSATVVGGENNTASGEYATVAGGEMNTASGDYAAVSGGGSANTASGAYSSVGGGAGNTASGIFAAVSAGADNVASGSNSAVAGGSTNVASAPYAAVGGGWRAKADKHGQQAQAAGRLTANGDAQTSVLVARRKTTSATPAELFLDGAALRCTIAADTTWAFRILVVARRTDADDESAAYDFLGCLDNNAGVTALVGAIAKTVVAEDSAAWNCDVTADDTNDALVITVTGEAAKTINWVARIELVETTG